MWIIHPVQEEAKTLSLELGVPIPIAQILVNRNISDPDEANRFLFGTLDHLHDPFKMEGIKEATVRIRKAIASGEKIVIFGDYDVDGILSVVSLSKALQSMGAKVEYFIPDRIKQGYGIKEEYIDVVLQKKASVVISVDCGIKAVGFVEKAREHGVDVIITDHHQPGSSLPQAYAILNPVLPSSVYPDRDLAGIGVVFKLIQALLEEEKKSNLVPHYLKMVSIGTIADVARLKGENRLMVKYGLSALENVSNIGLKSLMKNCGLMGKKITVGDIGFRMGPRINAAGRLGLTDLAVQLFFSKSEEESQGLVKQLDKLNSERQKIEEKILNQSVSQIRNKTLDKKYKLLILGCEEWHRGVIGIVASRLKDLFHHPVILFSYRDGKAFGSGRSIKDFSLIDCLEDSRAHLLNYGGHILAVGCELTRDNMTGFREAVNIFAEERISEQDLTRKIPIDVQIQFSDLTASFLDYLSMLSPFGIGNPKPVFLSQRAEVIGEPRKLNGKHSKFLLRQNSKIFEALGWGKGEWADSIRAGDWVDLAYSLQYSHYRGEERLNLSIEDIKQR
ncbi:single-stranded-DNA-specific exonuclease RecJ [Acidobacteriota bacterium]